MSSPRFPCACSPSTTRAHSFIPLSVIRGLRRFNREARLGRVHAAPCACGASSSVPLSTRAHSPIPLSVISRSSRYGPEEEWAYCILPGRCSGGSLKLPELSRPRFVFPPGRRGCGLLLSGGLSGFLLSGSSVISRSASERERRYVCVPARPHTGQKNRQGPGSWRGFVPRLCLRSAFCRNLHKSYSGNC